MFLLFGEILVDYIVSYNNLRRFLPKAQIELFSRMHPRAEFQGARVTVEGPFFQIQVTEGEKMRGWYPQNCTIFVYEAMGVAVVFYDVSSGAGNACFYSQHYFMDEDVIQTRGNPRLRSCKTSTLHLKV